MRSKQFGCMCKKAFLVFFLSYSGTLSLYGGGSASRHEELTDHTERESVYSSEEFGGYEAEFLKEVYEDSPQDVRYIVNVLKNPKGSLDEEDRFAVFYSQPGVGKTVQSFVVPYMAGWRCVNRVPSQLLSTERNGTARCLHDDIAKALEPGEKVVYIMQDFNVLVDQQELPERDNGTTAEQLLGLLDTHNRNPNFYFIGTSSELRYIGRPLKEKFLPHIIELRGPQTAEEKRRAIKKCLLRDGNVSLAPDCTDEFLDSILSESPSSAQQEGCFSSSAEQAIPFEIGSSTDRRAFRILQHRFARFDDPISDTVDVKRMHMASAMERIRRSKELCRYDKE